MIWMLLAQAEVAKPEEVAGMAERLNKGGVPVIALFFALMFAVALIVAIGKLLAKGETFTDLEKNYRQSIENKAAQDKTDAENRLKEAKADADKREDAKMAMMRERLQAEKESDATLAQAIHVIEADTRLVEKVDKRLDIIDDLKRQVVELGDRIRRLEDKRIT